MKKIILISLLMTLATIVDAQSPQAVRYQGVARNSSGTPLANQSIVVEIGIREGSASGSIVYLETHNLTTNQFGLYNLSIGQGNVQTGSFSSINWGGGAKFVE